MALHTELPIYRTGVGQAPHSHEDRTRLAKVLLARGKAMRAHDLGKVCA